MATNGYASPTGRRYNLWTVFTARPDGGNEDGELGLVPTCPTDSWPDPSVPSTREKTQAAPFGADGVSVASDHPPPSIHRLFKMAIWAGAETAVRLHIARGDDPNARDDAGLTPLMIAAARNKAAVCRLLIEAGADLAALDLAGRSALAIAAASGATDAAAIIELALAGQAQAVGGADLPLSPPSCASQLHGRASGGGCRSKIVGTACHGPNICGHP